MNALVATKAKVSRSMIILRRPGGLPQSQKPCSEQIDDFLMRVAGRVGREEWLLVRHGRRSV